MSTARVNVDKMMLEMRNQFDNWFEVFTTDMQKEVVTATAKNTVKKLKVISPRGLRKTKYYASTWKYTKDSATNGIWQYSMVVYNDGNYRLTHLLENGHALRNGGRTKAQPHISTAEEMAYDEMYDQVLDLISKSV